MKNVAGVEFKASDYYTFKEGALYRNVAAGQIKDRTRATRNAGAYKLFIDSFPDSAFPYSKYILADTKSGAVYEAEVPHYITGAMNTIVEALKEA